MMPAAVSPTSLDIYRDGGSLSVSFLDNEGMEYTLLFPVRLAGEGARRLERVGYFSPRLEWFVRTPRISRITGLESVETTKKVQEISWQEAGRILSELSPLIPAFDSQYAYVFPMMVAAANNDGAPGEHA